VNLDPNNARIRVEAARVMMALPFRAYKDIRYNLNGLCIRPSEDGGANILATDGHVLACIREVGGRCDRSTILPIDKTQLPFLRKGGHVLVDHDGRIWIADEAGVTLWISPHAEIEGTFPDVAGVIGPIDEYRDGLVGTFNPELLDKIRRVRPKQRFAKGVRFFHRDGDPTAAALCSLGHDGFVAIMGMRYDERENGLPVSVPADFQKAA
jgi:prepilin-type processing-associated H-X9-DG protein